MVDGVARMVLRTVYLEPELDEEVRLLAAREGRSRNDVMAEAVAIYLSDMTTSETVRSSAGLHIASGG